MMPEAARSFLFVPADRPDRFAKALASDADMVVFDLEDGVAPDAKDEARANLAELSGRRPALVRLNGLDTPWHNDDVAALKALDALAGIMIPKAEDSIAIDALARQLGKPLVALIESVRGLMHIRSLANAEGVARLAFGSVDFSLDSGMDNQALDTVQASLALESRYAELPPPIDGVTLAYRDASALAADIARARDFGFGGKLCIHPAQVGAVNTGFAPTDAEIDEARRIVAAAEAAGGAVTTLEGSMVDEPVVERARRILRLASANDVA